MSNDTRTDILCHAFAHLDALFTRHNVEAFVHLRRSTAGAVHLRFHTRWPAPQPLSAELDRYADELNLHFVPEHVEGAGLIVTLEPLPELEDL